MGMLISLDGGRIYSGNRLPENTSHAKGHLCKREQDIIIISLLAISNRVILDAKTSDL